MDYMTKLEGVPSTDQVKPGMAFFEGTGPEDQTCGKCKHRGYSRLRAPKWSERAKDFVEKSYPRHVLCDVQEAGRRTRRFDR